MRIGVFGGTFNPIHMAHLLIAEECRDRLNLDKVLFVPCAHPPHKRNDDIAPALDRLAMVRLAIEGHRHFEVDSVELDREGPSFTKDTLAELARRHPDDEIYYIVGRDAFDEMPTWKAPEEIVKLAQLVVVNRPSDKRQSEDWYEPILRVVVPDLGISAEEIRFRVRMGRSIQYWVPAGVEEYIYEKGLYQ
jgi:nicotinate-nucleotide adenylyltransferase